MTIIQIQCFLKTVEEMSVTRAAEQLYISRQVVSKHIKLFEKELGIALFKQGPNSIDLTEGGRLIYQSLHNSEKKYTEAVEAARRTNNCGESNVINIGISELVDDYTLCLHQFRQENPAAELYIETRSMMELGKGLKNKELDICIAFDVELEGLSTSYHVERLQEMKLAIVMGREHPLAKRSEVTMADLMDETFLVISPEYSKRGMSNVIGHCEAFGFFPKEIKVFYNYKSMEVALAAGKGVTIFFDRVFPDEKRQLRYYGLNFLRNWLPDYMVMAYHRKENPYIDKLAFHLRNIFACKARTKE